MPSPLLLATKFQAPLLRSHLLQREHLLQKLEKGLLSGGRLTLISAPAGYGKTTLAASWLEANPRATWLIVDEEDSHPVRFFACLIAALQKIDPKLGGSTHSLFDLAPRPSASALMEDLINDIALSTETFFLVLDDYHNIHNTEIHEAIETLVQHQPPALHLVLTTREDPPFPLSRLRGRGQLTEIRMRDLRFQSSEVDTLMEEAAGRKLPAGSIEKLEKITEGWAAGLQLAGLAIQSGEDASEMLETFSGEHQYIIEYLMDEVLRRLPADLQSFLRRAAIVEHFNADLCGALFDGEIDAQATLTYLDRANLFVIPLEANRQWYRFHRLFADVLRTGLDRREEQLLNQRAAGWFEQQGMASDAIQHYLACAQTENASRLIQQSSSMWLKQGELHTLLRWLRALPPAEVLASAGLAAAQALALIMTGELAQAAGLIQRIEQTSATDADSPETNRLLSLKAWLAMVSGKMDGSTEMAQQAVAGLPSTDIIFRGLALMALGTSCQWIGKLTASNTAFEEAYRISLEHGNLFAAMSALANFTFNLYDMGQVQRARTMAEDALAQHVDSRGKPLPVLALIYMPLSTFCLEQGDFSTARAYARQGIELCQRLFPSGMMGGDAEQSLAEIAFIEGDFPQAFSILENTRRFARERQVAFLDIKMTLLEAQFYLRMGETENARGSVNRLESTFIEQIPTMRHGLTILRAEIAIAEGNARQALDLLDDVDQSTRQSERVPRQIYRLLLRAACQFNLANEAAGLNALEKALFLASPEGYRKIFLHQPASVHARLPQLRSAAPRFVDELLEIVPKTERNAPVKSSRSSANAALAEPLSEQEQKVLRFIAAGLSNQQIAEELVISVGTAKWHVHNILGKLGASNRSQAIARAKALNIDDLLL